MAFRKALLIQLPVPKLNLGVKTMNIPLGGACLRQAGGGVPGWRLDLVPEEVASHAGDAALIRWILGEAPDVLGFTVFSWNLERSLYLAEKIKEKITARIVFGGPEITPDNVPARSPFVDFYVFGEGEGMIRSLLSSETVWGEKTGRDPSDADYLILGSPYVSGCLKTDPDHPMLVETQRGCPYRCGFCYYNKSRKNRSTADDRMVLDAVAFALERGVEEMYLLDPSLNVRPGLKSLMEQVAGLNRTGQLSLISEIRAEAVDEEMAALFRRAGFRGFEVGLQSTNPAAWEKMNRPTDLKAFLRGVKALQRVGITPTVDLIFGLPGDTLEGFLRTLDFVCAHHLTDHVQVFPLLVLPGTPFRLNSRKLGLCFDPSPPYSLISAPGFSPDDMSAALDAAEERLDRQFCLFPDLDAAFEGGLDEDFRIDLAGRPHVSKLVLKTPRPISDIQALADQIASPFQIFFGPEITDAGYQKEVLKAVSIDNPFVPLEVVFIQPRTRPDTTDLVAAAAVRRPHFLDQDLRRLYPEPGNRTVLFTVAAKTDQPFFQGEMERQVFLWDRPDLPQTTDLARLSHLDGILLGSRLPVRVPEDWQDRMASLHEDVLPISFSDIRLQVRWMALTLADTYDISLLEGQVPGL